MQRNRLAAIGAIVLFFLAGCGGGSTSVADDSSPPGSTVDAAEDGGTGETTTDTTGAETGIPATPASGGGAEPATLEDFLGTAAFAVRGFGGGALDADRIEQEQQLIQQAIQACMLAQGFEYVPVENTGGRRVFLRSTDQGVSDEDFAATEGFGISTRFDAIFEGEVDLTDGEPDPNDELLATLTEGEAEAWLFALRGDPPVRNDQGQLVDPDTGRVIQGGPGGGASGGCQLEAQQSVRGDLSELAELAEAWDELEDRIAADSRITEIHRAWSACMLDQGFDYRTEDEAREDFQGRFQPLVRSFFEGSGLTAGQGGGGGGRTAALQALADQGLTDEQEAELKALQDLEIAAATASLECEDGSDAEIAEIVAAYEAEFIESNRDALAAFAN